MSSGIDFYKGTAIAPFDGIHRVDKILPSVCVSAKSGSSSWLQFMLKYAANNTKLSQNQSRIVFVHHFFLNLLQFKLRGLPEQRK